MTEAAARRYIVVIQAAQGYPAKYPSDERPIPDPREPMVHTAVLERDYEALEAERDRLRALIAEMTTAARAVVDHVTHPEGLPPAPGGGCPALANERVLQRLRYALYAIDYRCADGHPTRIAEPGETKLPCGCVLNGASSEALAAAGPPWDRRA